MLVFGGVLSLSYLLFFWKAHVWVCILKGIGLAFIAKTNLLRWSSLLERIRHLKLRGIGDALVLFFYLPSLKLTAKAPEHILKRKLHLNQPLTFRCEVAVRFREGPEVGTVLGILSGTPGDGHFRGMFWFGIRLPHKKVTTAVCICCAKRHTFQWIWWNFQPQVEAIDGWAPWVTMYLLIWSLNRPILRIFFCHAEKGLCATKLDHHKQKVAMLHRSTLHGTAISPTKVQLYFSNWN